jgi:Caspase domain/TPR repeat
MRKLSTLSSGFLILVITSVGEAGFAQQNSNCFNSAMPPMDIIAACDQNIAADSRGAQDYQARGAAWYRMGDYDRAIADFTQSINIDSKYIRAFYNRGLAWEKKGNLDNALTDFKYFVGLDPTFPDAQKALVRVSIAKKTPEATTMKQKKPVNAVAYPSASPNASLTFNETKPLNSIPRPAVLQGRRLALVIGNDAYQHVPQLQKAVGDADAMSQTLKTIGFTVVEGKDLTFEQTARLLADFEGNISKSDIVFFHFSGHGVQIKGDNILLPTDTPQPQDGQQSLVQKFGLSAEAVIQGFNERGASLVVAVLDACRDNPFASSGTRGIGGSRGLAALTPVEGTFVIYSAGVNQTALDKLNNRDLSPTSVFTRVVTPLLQEPNSLIEIAKKAQVGVRDLARTVGHEQTPAYYDQVIGNVRLVE